MSLSGVLGDLFGNIGGGAKDALWDSWHSPVVSPKPTNYTHKTYGDKEHNPPKLNNAFGYGKTQKKAPAAKKKHSRWKTVNGVRYYKPKGGKWVRAKSQGKGNKNKNNGRPAPGGGGGGGGRPSPGAGGGGSGGGGGMGGQSMLGLGKAEKRAINAAVESILRQEIGPMDKERKRIKAQERAQLRQADRAQAGYNAAMAELRQQGLNDTTDMLSVAANNLDHRPEQAQKNQDLIKSLFGNTVTESDGVADAMAEGNQRAFGSAMALGGQNHANYMDRARDAAASGHVERLGELRRDSQQRRRDITDAINMVQGKRGSLRYEMERQALNDLLKQQAASQAFGLQLRQQGHNELMDNARLALSKKQTSASRDYDFADIQSILYGTEREVSKVVEDAKGNPKTVSETIRDGGAATRQEALQNLIAIGVPKKQARKIVAEWANQQVTGSTVGVLDSLQKMFPGIK